MIIRIFLEDILNIIALKKTNLIQYLKLPDSLPMISKKISLNHMTS